MINLSSPNILHASVDLGRCMMGFCSKQAQQIVGPTAFFEPSFQSCRAVASHPAGEGSDASRHFLTHSSFLLATQECPGAVSRQPETGTCLHHNPSDSPALMHNLFQVQGHRSLSSQPVLACHMQLKAIPTVPEQQTLLAAHHLRPQTLP